MSVVRLCVRSTFHSTRPRVVSFRQVRSSYHQWWYVSTTTPSPSTSEERRPHFLHVVHDDSVDPEAPLPFHPRHIVVLLPVRHDRHPFRLRPGHGTLVAPQRSRVQDDALQPAQNGNLDRRVDAHSPPVCVVRRPTRREKHNAVEGAPPLNEVADVRIEGGEEQGPLAFPLALVPCLCDLHRTQDVVDHSFDLGWRRDRHVVWRRKLNLNVEPLASEQSA